MGKNAGTGLGAALTLVGAGVVGIPLLAADLAEGGDLLNPEMDGPEFPDLTAEDRAREEAAAKDAERRRLNQTQNRRSGTAAEALSGSIGRTSLGSN